MFRRLDRQQVVLDLLLAAGYLVVVPFLGRAMSIDGPWPATVAVVVVFTGALAVRRASPALALTIAWIAAIVQMVLLLPPGLADTAVFAVLYTTAAYGSRRVFWAGFASVPAGAGVATGYLFVAPIGSLALSWSVERFLVVLVLLLLALGLSWTVGALVRTALQARKNRLAQVRAQAEAVAEAQRVRIARDMHDVVAHSLAVVIAQADGARYAAATDPSAATAALTTIGSTARAALADVRQLLAALRHSQQDGPQPGLADVEELFAQVRTAGLDLRVTVSAVSTGEPSGEPSAAVQLAVYRILQESLTNALRHGDGGPVLVDLAWHADRVEIEVRNGAGAPIDAGPAVGDPGAAVGHGLIGMRERAQLVGGVLTAGLDDTAFRVHATLPTG